GVAVMGLVMRVDYHVYREPAFIWSFLGVVALSLVAVLFSPPVNNARRWFSVGGLGIQPSELAKLAAIFFIAALLERRMHRTNEVRYALVPIGIVIAGLVGLILLEPDFGTAISLALIAAILIFVAGLNYASCLVGTLLAVAPFAAVVVLGAGYPRPRLLAFLNPWADQYGDGFQLIQSLIAVGTGGISGRGLMNSVQKLFYLPEPHTDFIYAVIAEEFGLIGATLVLGCFCIITWRGLRTTLGAPDPF